MHYRKFFIYVFIFPISVVVFLFAMKAEARAQSFSCLSNPGPTEVISGAHPSGKFEPDIEPNKKFDARTATFTIPRDISHGKVVLRGSNGDDICWAGGYITASLDWHGLDVSWERSKLGFGADGSNQNTSSVDSFHTRTTWTGVHVFNVHDGMRTNHSDNNWTIQHTWLDYIRDDCIENDHIYSGTVYDSLFDGCYSGISTRPSSPYSSAGQTFTIDKLLLRMEPMPYPYKWDTKSTPKLTVPGYGDIPFANGSTFKLEEGNEPDFRITNSIFLHEYDSGKMLFPPKSAVSVCQNNTIIWLGDAASAPDHLLTEFPGCFTLITNHAEGRQRWKTAVADWHSRHPDVGVNRKPANPGDYSWPRYGAGASPTPTPSASPTPTPSPSPTPTPTASPSPTPSPSPSPTPTPTKIPGDTDGDKDVDIFDLNNIVRFFGQEDCMVNQVGSCVIDVIDYESVITSFE